MRTGRVNSGFGWSPSGGRSELNRKHFLRSVDVELVSLGVFHRHRVVIEAFRGHDSEDRGTKFRQPLCLSVDSLFALVRSGGGTDRPPELG